MAGSMNQKPSQLRLTFSRSHGVVSRTGARAVLGSRAMSPSGSSTHPGAPGEN